MNRTMMTCTTLIASAAAVVAALIALGPLNPPSGAVTSTNKTLAEIEPRTAIDATNTPGDANSLFKISTPGSYYLTGNVTGVTGKHGIEIATSNVTIDLNGFTVNGATGALFGIVSSGSITNVTVKNGSVNGWPSGGMVILGNGVFTAQDLSVNSNTGNGIIFDTGRVLNCSATLNTGIGIRVGQGGTITGCFASSNGVSGIEAGIIGSVTACSASSNGGVGILIGGNSIVSNSTSQQNGAAGFSLDFSSLATDCVSRSNTGVGFDARGGSSVLNCSANSNGLDGILAASRSIIIQCNATQNGTSATTPGAGIRLTGSDNRIEGNNCIQNDQGVKVEATGNIIIKNTCSGNSTNWDIAIGNSVGPIVVAGTNAAAISGNGPVAGTLGSSDPNANFSY